MRTPKEQHAAYVKKQRAEEAEKAKAKKVKLQATRNAAKIDAGTLLTLHSYMFHVFCFTSIKVIIFNTDILNSRAGTFSLTHSLTHSLTLTHLLADSLTQLNNLLLLLSDKSY